MGNILYLSFGIGLIVVLTACSTASNEQNSESASPAESAKISNSPVLPASPPALITPPAASPPEGAPNEAGGNESMENGIIPIHISVGSTIFTATLHDNETTQALIAQFPVTFQMKELNGLEKYYNLSEDLPAQSTERPATIHAGDITNWSGNTLVLFYQTFSNSFGGYVPLGQVDDPSNLASALGSGSVQVTWSLAD
ncbi:cyclophilin-like fold protein [Paenibacillus sp. IHBB 3054]|uniref:cyclophilin-like fold protein n=1 Tax=Paenibacillus sp. IHBB 3054 TaxID=3425689 RepID=UPI003F6638E2